ncbi:S41 family peptidase [Pirellulales bacterium]|nr:S41 family peptidase [Pirellulales bacterium]
MQRRVYPLTRFLSLVAALSVGIAWLPVTSARAQISRSEEPVAISEDALSAPTHSAALQEGQRLESQRRWAEALSYYEDALRHYPGDDALLRRQDLAKLHYSLERRYSDRSFQRSVRSLDMQRASALYLELLRKINTHYVDAPPWKKLGLRGVRAVELALLDDTFAKVNGVRAAPTQISDLRRDLYAIIGRHATDSPRALVALASEVARVVHQKAGLSEASTAMEFVAAAAGGLDDYSAYLTADQLRDVYSQIEGNFVGLGVELRADQGALLIVHVISGSPAERAGILDGDRITAVDGQTTSDLSTDQAAALLTGAEGSYVTVTIETSGKAPRRLNIRREHVDVPSLEGARIVDKEYGVAYVKIPAFQKTTARDLDAALWDLHRKGMRSLILDLRDNPGGLLTASVELADKFLQQGGIVSTRGRSAQEDFNYRAHYGGTWRVPLVVLINGDSASASEIFAGAIKDNDRGAIIGARSFGKGSVQGIFPLGQAGAGIRLTTALFYSPKGKRISKHGVDPDVAVNVTARPVDGSIDLAKDLILEQGISAARSQAAPLATRSASR